MWLCLDQFVAEYGVVICSALLAVEVLVFSIFAQIYSNLIQNANTADVNMYSFALQGSSASRGAKAAYREIAVQWFRASEEFRYGAKSRAYSANASVLALLFIAVTFSLSFFTVGCLWLLFLLLSVLFLFLALLIYIADFFPRDGRGDTCFKFLRLPSTSPYLSRWNHIEELIVGKGSEWCWLKDLLRQSKFTSARTKAFLNNQREGGHA